MEIMRFFRLLKPENANTISKAGYLKQRMKLNPEAFMVLSDFHVKNFYEEEKDLKKFKGHFVFAVDGSHVNLPNTPENEDHYGFHDNRVSHQTQAGVSCLYDLLNRMVLDLSLIHI